MDVDGDICLWGWTETGTINYSRGDRGGDVDQSCGDGPRAG